MKKNKNKFIIIIISVLVVLFLILSSFVTIFYQHEIFFFDDLDSFSELNEYVVDDLNEKNDKYLKDIEFDNSYLKKISYNKKEYYVYAYVFYDIEDAKQYFKNATGKTSNEKWNFSSSSNIIFASNYISFYENCVFRIEGKNYFEFQKMLNFIAEIAPLNNDVI